MSLDDAITMAKRHEETYNDDFEHYADLYAPDCVIYRPAQGMTQDRATMAALEQRATAACPDRKTHVLKVFAAEGDWMGMEELWEGTNSGGDERFGQRGTRVAVYAVSLCEVRDGKFTRVTAWTGRPPATG
ncbi:MAG: nuclear transport factor 2 family protein [Dehalococcoidia bacterium]